MRRTSFLVFLSVAALLGGVASQLAGWESVRGWCLLAWAVFMLPAAIALAWHPMRVPAFGLFVGFWGVIGALALIVVQILSAVGVLAGEAYRMSAAGPLALLGIWFIVASVLGFGAERFPRWVDVLGVLAGAGLIAIGLTTVLGASSVAFRAAGLMAAVAYCVWAAAFGWVLWGAQDVSHRFRGLAVERAA